MLSSRFDHGYHDETRGALSQAGPLGLGFVLVIPTPDIQRTRRLWELEGLLVTLEPEDTGWAQIFYGLDPDGYEMMFEQFT